MTAGEQRDACEGAGGAEFAHAYPAVAASVGAIRRALTEFARNCGAGAETEHAVALAASEAATNAVVHAYRERAEPGCIEVTAAQTADGLSVSVGDAGSGLRPYREGPALGLGLGLAIIARVAERVDVVRSRQRGVEVRMFFALRTASERG